MLIYIFVDIYPNPYKPYFDSQFKHFLQKGHKIFIFAQKEYKETLNRIVIENRLDENRYFYPSTLNNVPNFFTSLISLLFQHPIIFISKLYKAIKLTIINNDTFSSLFRIMLLPTIEPDICLVHNLAVAEKFTFLKYIYPHTRLILYFHGGEIPDTPIIKNKIRAFNYFDQILTNTQFSRQVVINQGGSADKIYVSPIGFNINDYPDIEKRRYKPDKKLRLISVGRLSKEKGLIYSINAIKELVNTGFTKFEYTIIGDGPQRAEIEELIHNNKLEKFIRLKGELSHELVIKEMANSDILILSSISTNTSAETQACVVQEALLMKTIVITTDVGGVPESINKSMKYFIVSQKDSHSLASMIRNVANLDEASLKALGEQGREFVINNYNINNVNRIILDESQFKGSY